MSAKLVKDWLQVGAGMSAIFGIFFLSIGLFNNDDKGKKDAKRFAPILMATATAAIFAYAPYALVERFHLPPVIHSSGVVIAGAVGGLIVGYVAGYRISNAPLWCENKRAEIIALLVVMAVVVGILVVVPILIWILAQMFAPQLIPQDFPLRTGIGLVLLGLAIGSVFAVRYIPPIGLKIMGMVLSIASVVLAIWPALVELLQAPIK